MTKYSKMVYGETPQTEPMFGEKQVRNNAGGYVYKANEWDVLNRFLILGSEKNTYYVEARELTKENAQNVLNLIAKDGRRVVKEIVAISDAGRAPKNDSAIFALALCGAYGNDETRAEAFSALPKVCRTATHLFQFVDNISNMRGWGKGLRKAISKWYLSKDADSLAYQLIKYKNREGWTHKDVITLAHPKPVEDWQQFMFNTTVKGFDNSDFEVCFGNSAVDKYFIGCNFAKFSGVNIKRACKLIEKYNFPREVVPTEMLNNPEIWDALMSNNMPMTAMIRNLGKMSSIGYLTELSDASRKICDMLTNKEVIKKARIHPINLLLAYNTYNRGCGFRGNLNWNPVQSVVSALQDAFYMAFDNIEPTGKRFFIGLDVSGSMSCECYEGISSAMAGAVIGMSLMRSEKQVAMYGFADNFRDLRLNSRMSLDEIMRRTDSLSFGGTDCALPMRFALNNKISVDDFVVITDNECWAGRIHPKQAIDKYRNATGIDAKLTVLATTPTEFSIADSTKNYMLDISGFDSSVPKLVQEFAKGF
jgi:60 kDa SS-A/Ro ribonucleoprotein